MNTNKAQNFQYSFNLSDVITHLHVYDDSTQALAEKWIVDVIYESFIKTADQDYLTARLLAQKGLHRGFFWGIAQATEKYLKAFLLLNGRKISKFSGHPILKLFNASKEVNSKLKDIDTSVHEKLKNTSGVNCVMQKMNLEELLSSIEEQGSPHSRYNSVGVQYHTGFLFAFDAFAYQIRNFLLVPEISESFSKLAPELVEAFHVANPWFDPTPESDVSYLLEDLHLCASFEVTALEFIAQNKTNVSCDIALQWLSEMMVLPKEFRIS